MKKHPHYHYLSLEEKTVLFFQETKKELGGITDKKLEEVVCRIFCFIRRTLSDREMQMLLFTMPVYLKLLWSRDRQCGRALTRMTHLDELVETIYQAEQRNPLAPVFHSEIEVLHAVIIVLKKLDNMFGTLSLPGFSFTLVQEIREVSLDEAALV